MTICPRGSKIDHPINLKFSLDLPRKEIVDSTRAQANHLSCVLQRTRLEEILGVQPMSGPTDLVFALRARYKEIEETSMQEVNTLQPIYQDDEVSFYQDELVTFTRNDEAVKNACYDVRLLRREVNDNLFMLGINLRRPAEIANTYSKKYLTKQTVSWGSVVAYHGPGLPFRNDKIAIQFTGVVIGNILYCTMVNLDVQSGDSLKLVVPTEHLHVIHPESMQRKTGPIFKQKSDLAKSHFKVGDRVRHIIHPIDLVIVEMSNDPRYCTVQRIGRDEKHIVSLQELVRKSDPEQVAREIVGFKTRYGMVVHPFAQGVTNFTAPAMKKGDKIAYTGEQECFKGMHGTVVKHVKDDVFQVQWETGGSRAIRSEICAAELTKK